MATIRIVQEQDASDEVKVIFDEIKQRYGLDFVPNFWKVQAHNPAALKIRWEGYKQAEDILGQEIVNIIGLATATAMGSPYTIVFHTAMLKQLGYDDKKLEALVSHMTIHIAGDSYSTALLLEPDAMQELLQKDMAA